MLKPCSNQRELKVIKVALGPAPDYVKKATRGISDTRMFSCCLTSLSEFPLYILTKCRRESACSALGSRRVFKNHQMRIFGNEISVHVRRSDNDVLRYRGVVPL